MQTSLTEDQRALPKHSLPGELEIVALAGHPNRNLSDAGPRVQPCAESPESAVIRGHGAPGEAERCHEEWPALISHVYCASPAVAIQPMTSERRSNAAPAITIAAASSPSVNWSRIVLRPIQPVSAF
jgi:hypothetical protein